MTLGLVARADQRGIGIMTGEFHRHMNPDKVLIVSHGRWEQNFNQYASADWCRVVDLDLKDLSLNEATCREFLDGLDVVYCVETLYDWRFKQWAEDAGCEVVIHGMPELYSTRDHDAGRPHPDVWLWPTDWMTDGGVLPYGPIVPVPCVEREVTARPADDDGPLRVLHVAGVRAAGDRNGTLTMMEALRYVREDVHVRFTIQDPNGLPTHLPKLPPNVHVDVHRNVADRWSIYHDRHVLVSPRHFGGLSLPVLEAMSCGLAICMTDVEPNRQWPIHPIPITSMDGQRCPYGYVPSANISARHVAQQIDHLARDRRNLAYLQGRAKGWADSHSWTVLKPLYDEVLR